MSELVVKKSYIADNYRELCSEIGVTVIPMLKGNAYGLGDTETASALYDAGAKTFAVSRLEEALRLHGVLKDAEILLLSPYGTEAAVKKILECGITATVGSYDSAVLLNGAAARQNRKCRVHFAFDTGMGRYGFLPAETGQAVKAAKYLPNLELCGCFSHFSNSFSKDNSSVHEQTSLFNECLSELEKSGINPGMRHIANSNAALKYPETRFDAVRIGSALLGRVAVGTRLKLKDVCEFSCDVCEVRWLPAGQNVGYGNTFKTKKAVRIAVIPAGYADGLYVSKVKDTFRLRDVLRYGWQDAKSLIGKGSLCCEINGRSAPLIGRIGFTTVVADISKIECEVGDRAKFHINPMYVNSNVERRYV